LFSSSESGYSSSGGSLGLGSPNYYTSSPSRLTSDGPKGWNEACDALTP